MSSITSMQQQITITSASVSTSTETTSAKDAATTSSEVAAQKPTQTNLRASLNAQIVQASLSVSIKAGDNSQALLFRSALDSIYEALGDGFQSSIMPDYKMPSMTDDNNPYATPEGTANVILSFSLSLYASYSEGHKGEDSDETATNFINLIRGGFEKGFKEATDILKGLSVFEGEIKTDIEKTWELVQKGYDDWLAAQLTPAQTEEPSETQE